MAVREENGIWTLHTNLGEYLQAGADKLITTKTLGMAFEPEQPFENPDGTEIIFDEDYFGEKCNHVISGPFARIADNMRV